MNGATLPSRIGPYLVERQLGAGGMGEVYLAYSVAGEPVAVKVIRPDRTDPHTRARFEREATIARTISGTGRVARFIEADPFAEQPWLAMDYVPGRPLSDVVQDQGPLSTPLVASLGALLAEGLAAVHAAGLVHRDLKAQNVILGDFGPVIIDFGLGAFVGASKGSLTQAGSVIGTVRCMPPEQALGQVDVTQAADVYGLGTILLYTATGHYPYDGVRWEAVAAQVVNPEIGPDLSGLPDELAPVVTAMLAHKADDRPSLEEVTRQCADLMRLLGTSPARARRALIQETTAKDHPTMVQPQPDAPMLDRLDSLERLLRKESASPVENIPVPSPGGESGPGTPVESDVASSLPPVLVPAPEPGPRSESPAEPVPQRGRPPASRRVAEDLRERYAVRLALAWSKR
ncbi:serine/threonine-protein kinase [Streptomyces iranensis]|uniref:Serine/threonine protein kinase n=1 Tax=Streptomyces iranensis TaxID=576784 RepID=A0A060ZX21_9ACTN|nr:serine/threonine-protein kinase [Streptomyces iranensis]MBP2059611.1 serine/threonine protein kinase [Streptomyces iranensis]CDR10417.1 serine/threonine protein kinase [Streptomyces iranensis]